jgi:hypothetical protein
MVLVQKAFRKRCSEQNAVHDVDMEPVGFICIYHFDVALQESAARTEGAIIVFFHYIICYVETYFSVIEL